MTGAGEAQRGSDLELAGEIEELVRANVEALRREMNTSTPAIVRKFDEASQTVQCTPVHKRLFIDEDTSIVMPDYMDVPVAFPRGGNFVLTFPIAAGDEVLVVFSQRTIDNWWDRGGVQDPLPLRFHDASDAMAIPGLGSRPRFIQSFATDAAELRSLDGTVVLRMEGSRIVLTADQVIIGGDAAGTEPAAKGQTLQTWINLLSTALQTHVHPVSGSATLVAPALQVAALPAPPTITADKAKVL